MTTTTTRPKTIGIHKQGEEGVLLIDGLSGQVTQPLSERPEWSDGLVCAKLADRFGWYTQRTGSNPPPTDLMAFEDLGWVAIHPETGEAVELEHDSEFRQQVIAEMIGLKVTEDAIQGDFEATAEVDQVAYREARSAGEHQELLDSQAEPFAKTGTEG